MARQADEAASPRAARTSRAPARTDRTRTDRARTERARTERARAARAERARSALAVTRIEEPDMAAAAINGVTKPAIATGNAIAL